MNDLRIEARFRNNVLWHAIFDVFPSVAAFCQANGLDQGRVGELLNLKLSPKGRRRDWTPFARRLSDATGIGLDELFPDLLYDTPELRARRVAEVTSVQFVSLAEARRVALLPDAEDAIERERLQGAMAHVLDTLTPREQLVIKQRFGLAGNDETTYESIARHLHVSTERARQIEAKAMRKLRHPSRVRIFDPYRWQDNYDQHYRAEQERERAEREAWRHEPPSTPSPQHGVAGFDDFDALRARAERLDPARADEAIAVGARVPDDVLDAMGMTRRHLQRDIYEALTWQDAYRKAHVDNLFGNGGDAFVDHMARLAGAYFHV